MKNLYTVVDRSTKEILSVSAFFEREQARNFKQTLKQRGLDPVILRTKLDRESAAVIR